MAVTDANVPIISKENLPFKYNDLGQPLYRNDLIVIDCAPCVAYCQYCASGWLKNLKTGGCVVECPNNMI